MTWGPAGSWPLGSGSCSAMPCVGFTIGAGWCWASATGFRSWYGAVFCPADHSPARPRLAHNDSGRFEARWVKLVPRPGLSPFVTFNEPIELPVAHGEGKFLTAAAGPTGSPRTEWPDRPAIRLRAGRPTQDYPANPNGSAGAAAGVCDATGRIFGLMPHPERFIESWHHPRWTRRVDGSCGRGGWTLDLSKCCRVVTKLLMRMVVPWHGPDGQC